MNTKKCIRIAWKLEIYLKCFSPMAGINQIIFVWLLTSLIGHNYHSGAGPGSLGVNNLEGNQILGVGRQPGDDVSEIHKNQLSDYTLINTGLVNVFKTDILV